MTTAFCDELMVERDMKDIRRSQHEAPGECLKFEIPADTQCLLCTYMTRISLSTLITKLSSHIVPSVSMHSPHRLKAFYEVAFSPMPRPQAAFPLSITLSLLLSRDRSPSPSPTSTPSRTVDPLPLPRPLIPRLQFRYSPPKYSHISFSHTPTVSPARKPSNLSLKRRIVAPWKRF